MYISLALTQNRTATITTLNESYSCHFAPRSVSDEKPKQNKMFPAYFKKRTSSHSTKGDLEWHWLQQKIGPSKSMVGPIFRSVGASSRFWEPLAASGSFWKLWEPVRDSGSLLDTPWASSILPFWPSGSLWNPLGASGSFWELLEALGTSGNFWELLAASASI